MPEGPEIRRAADKLAAAIAQRFATAVFFAFDQLKPYEELLQGERVTAVTSRGKAMLTHFENGYTIFSHNQLYGKWFVQPAGELPDTNRQLRLAIHNDDYSALLYSASDIDVWRTVELETHPFLEKLGPDLLDDSVTIEQVAARFTSDAFRRRQLASLLLDQGFLAGLGNYLRSEILFVAQVHPQARPMDCTPAQIAALAQAAVQLTRQSYETGGVTNDLGRVADLKAEGVGYRDYRFWAFARQNWPCYACGTPIVKERIGGRRLYYCPNCQQSANTV